MRFTVSGIVIPGVGDHSAMLVDVEMEGVIDVQPKWNNRRQILIDSGDDAVISNDLKEEFYHVAPACIDFIEKLGGSIPMPSVDEVTDIFINTVDDIRKRNATFIIKVMSEGKSPERCKASRDVQYALNRV